MTHHAADTSKPAATSPNLTNELRYSCPSAG
jgi:hypothetical protein